MYPRYSRKRENRVERVMRPGVLLLSLLIGFTIVFLLVPDPSQSPVMADRSAEDYASVDEPDIHDDLTDQQTTTDDTVDDTLDTETSDNGLVDEIEDPYQGGAAGEGYDDDVEPRPGDNEEIESSEDNGEPVADTETASEEGEPEDEGRHRECIYVRSMDSYHVIDDRHLTVSTGPRRMYLLTLRNRCYGLKWARTIVISSRGSWSCSNSLDTIVAGKHRCLIDDIERVGSKAEAESLVSDRANGD